MHSGNVNKRAFLGMPGGTAASQLRKQILFKYVKLAGDGVCFKCGNDIETVEELSIEHKLPWLNISVDLFWDLENIAFSHLKCNRPHTFASRLGERKLSPEGTSWCPKHQEHLPLENFHKSKNKSDGVDSYCKTCVRSSRQKLNTRSEDFSESRAL